MLQPDQQTPRPSALVQYITQHTRYPGGRQRVSDGRGRTIARMSADMFSVRTQGCGHGCSGRSQTGSRPEYYK